MTADNVEIVSQAIAAINDRDVERYLALCAADIELVSPTAAIEGASAGESGIREFFAGVEETTDEFRLEVEALRELSDGRVLAFLRVTTRSKRGVSLAQPATNVYALSDGKLRRVTVYRDRDEALAAVGLTA
ncbi:MAG TPA: nuclear transport factor 2 family protein [Solirubrobacteraceae bacterium]|nr:nuclear transport factor 2 family protein [Solirubrobacteraceae bacterium]